MKTTIIYHEIRPGVSCADGIVAAWVANKKYPDAVLVGCSYGQEPPKVDCDRLVIVDFSFPIEVLASWELQGIDVLVIDHQKTAMNDLGQFSNAIFDMQESVASLTWKTFFPDEPVPAFVEHVKDRDLWNFTLEGTQEIHEAMAFIGRDLWKLDRVETWDETELKKALFPLGTALLRPKRERIQEIAQESFVQELWEYQVILCPVAQVDGRLVSDLSTFLYRNTKGDFTCTFTPNEAEGRFDLSFRSDKDGNNFDVSAIAKSLGGGGHRNAAGANMSWRAWLEFLSGDVT